MLVPNALLCRFAYAVGLGFICVTSALVLKWSIKSTDLALATGHGDVDEAASVSEPLLRAALGGLLLLLGLNL